MTYAELRENVVVCLWWVWIASHGALNDGQTQTPDVTLDRVSSTTRVCAGGLNTARADSFRRHVGLATNVRFGNTGNQVSTDTEIADLDGTGRVDENVGGLDIAMDDVVFILQALQAQSCCVSDFPQDVLWDAVTIDLVNGSTVHELHANVHGTFLEEGAVKVDYLRRRATM